MTRVRRPMRPAGGGDHLRRDIGHAGQPVDTGGHCAGFFPNLPHGGGGWGLAVFPAARDELPYIAVRTVQDAELHRSGANAVWDR